MDVLEFVFKLKIWRVMIEEGNEYLGGSCKLRIFLNLCCYWKMLNCGGNSLLVKKIWVVIFRYIIMLCV